MTSRAGATTVALALLALGCVSACGGPDDVEGTVVAVSGTGQKDRPLGGGWIAVLEDDSFTDFLGQSGIDVPGSTDLPYAAGRVLHDDVTQAGGVLAPVDDKGTFRLTMTGRHTLCRLVEAPQVDLLKGCAVVDLPATGRLTLSTQSGGLFAKLDG